MKISKKISFIFLMIGISMLSFGWHKYFISLTVIDLNKTDKIVEISIKLFTDDLVKTLKLPESSKIENNAGEMLLMNYLKKSFFLEIDGKKMEYKMVGVENDTDLTWVYLQIENTLPLKSITVTNTIFTETYTDQINLIYLNQTIGTISEIADKQTPTKIFDLK
jgi:hypothetical protein